MKEIFRRLLGFFVLLCVVIATTCQSFSSDDYIYHINQVQHQWKADHNFDEKTEDSLLNFYLSRLGEPLTPEEPQSKDLWSTIVNFFKPKPARRPAATPTIATVNGAPTSVILTTVIPTTVTPSTVIPTTVTPTTVIPTTVTPITIATPTVVQNTITISICDMTTDDNDDATNEGTDYDYNGDCYDDEDHGLPTQFDARDDWPFCKDTISNILESSLINDCPTDWATSVVGSIQDRYCIKKNAENRTLSIRKIVENCSCKDNCQGSAETAYDYLKKFGVPLGALTNEEDCRSYSNGVLKHENNYETSYEEDLVKLDDYCQPVPVLTVAWNGYESYNVDMIKREIQRFGPVTATINFYRDFLYYKAGVYAPTQGSQRIGKLSVKVIGWGSAAGKDYWLVSNSWSQNWGDRGFAKVEAWNPKLGLEWTVISGRLNV